MKYLVVVGYSAVDISKTINKYLSCGWKLVGGVSVGVDTDTFVYAQAIIKEDEEE